MNFLLDTRMPCCLCLTLQPVDLIGQPTPPPGYFADELPQALDSHAIPWLFIQILPLEAVVAVLMISPYCFLPASFIISELRDPSRPYKTPFPQVLCAPTVGLFPSLIPCRNQLPELLSY